MYPRPLLNEADHLRLQALLDETSTPRLNAENTRLLRQFLQESDLTKTEANTRDRVGLYDVVTLVSPADSRDWFKLRIVMPAEQDPDDDRISILAPIARAVLGRRSGERVSWEAPAGLRQMSIATLRKAELQAR
jgi:transcription elongation GreA/GreB family factor